MNKDQTIKHLIKQNNKVLDLILLQIELTPKLLQTVVSQIKTNEKAIDLF